MLLKGLASDLDPLGSKLVEVISRFWAFLSRSAR